MARKKIVGAILQGEMIIGDLVIPCAVLKDGTRVLTQKGFSRALGRVKYSSKVVTKLPPFLSANNLKPFISEELQEVTTPIKFKSISGGGYKGYSYGYNASLLPAVLKVNIRALQEKNLKSDYLSRYERIAQTLTGNVEYNAEDAVEFIAQLKSDLQIPPLSQFGVLEVDYPEIIVKAASSSSMKGNPVILTPDEMYTILELSQ